MVYPAYLIPFHIGVDPSLVGRLLSIYPKTFIFNVKNSFLVLEHFLNGATK